MIRGSCLCGAVRYEIDGAPARLVHCHCSQCRKAHGAAYATYACVPAAGFRVVLGGERVRRYRSSPGAQRSFCAECGSNIAFEPVPPGADLWVAAGGFDDPPGILPDARIHVASRADWDVICDSLAQHPAGLPAPEREGGS